MSSVDSEDSAWIADSNEIDWKSSSNYLISDIQATITENIQEITKDKSVDLGTLRKIDLGRLWQWISCIIGMDFDMDTGPSVEVVYPPLEFTQEEEKQLAFLSFPDSNTFNHLGDSQFSFRTKEPEIIKLLSKGKMPDWASSKCGLDIENDGMIYGYVFFRMKRDGERKRGYFQVCTKTMSEDIIAPHFSLL
jgi:hypothetical protein